MSSLLHCHIYVQIHKKLKRKKGEPSRLSAIPLEIPKKMFNRKGVVCMTGYKKLGKATQDAHMERAHGAHMEGEGYMFNNKGVPRITAYHRAVQRGGAARSHCNG